MVLPVDMSKGVAGAFASPCRRIETVGAAAIRECRSNRKIVYGASDQGESISMNQFKELVESLDREGLDELRKSVTTEVDERRQKSTIHMEQIRPGMSDEQKDLAHKEISRVLRGEE